MGATVQQEKQLMQQTRDLGRSTKFTAQEVAEAQMYQAMAGMKTNEVLEMTPKLLKMSIAAGSDFAQTSDIVTDNLTAFGMSLKDSNRLMDVMVGAMRGIGYSILPMIVSLVGACGLRIVWIYTVFAKFRTLDILFISYPVTWTITFVSHLVCYYIVTRKYKDKFREG